MSGVVYDVQLSNTQNQRMFLAIYVWYVFMWVVLDVFGH